MIRGEVLRELGAARKAMRDAGLDPGEGLDPVPAGDEGLP
jgi:hypothetical protein